MLRDGRSVGTGELSETTDADIVSLMVGRSVSELFPSVPHSLGDVVLRVTGLSGGSSPVDVSFELRRGEILGIAGLIGAGRTELLRCLFGLDEVASGDVDRSPDTLVRTLGRGRPSYRVSPHLRIAEGFGLVSEDRKTEGLAQSRSIADNMTYSRLKPYSRFGWLNLKHRRTAVVDWMRRLRVKANSPEQSVGDLSGGNQQKVAIARVLHQEADILMLDEPTRGIDVGTKAEIYRLMGEQAAAGKAIIFVSSYLTELLAVCDRVAVLSRGRWKDVRSASDWTEEAVMAVAVSVNESVA